MVVLNLLESGLAIKVEQSEFQLQILYLDHSIDAHLNLALAFALLKECRLFLREFRHLDVDAFKGLEIRNFQLELVGRLVLLLLLGHCPQRL